MGLFGGLWLIVLGVLGAASLIIAKKPNAKELIDKLVPFQGWIGAVSAIWGLVSILMVVLSLGLLGFGITGIIYWISYLASALLTTGLGLLLGVGVLKTFIKQPQAVAKMDETIRKIGPYQGKMGIAAIAVGLWFVVAGFILL
jgi:hypothetical protein